MVRLKGLKRLSEKEGEMDFNSYMVRLKVAHFEIFLTLHLYFNSYMVRLKVVYR